MLRSILSVVFAPLLGLLPLDLPAQVPQTVEETWADFDPKAEPMQVEVIRESTDGGIILRHLRYLVGTFGEKQTRVAAFYAFPSGGANLPGIIQVHGGGQRASADAVEYWASQGYAAISVNWGELPIGEAGSPNTDWAGIPAGFLDPKHHNEVAPAEGTLHDVPHPWNSSWSLYSAAVRRAITFLQEQPEVDGEKIGLTGHSMGGRLTVLSAIDPRIKAATPSVGGSGYLYSDIAGIPGSARRMEADLELYNSTLDGRNYWPLIRCPVLFLGATNDFNSPMELVVRAISTLPHSDKALSFTPHMNHRFTSDNYAARVRWFDTHLKGNFEFPKMATSQLLLQTPDGIPRFKVQPDLTTSHPLHSVSIYYGYARDPRNRFWRSAEVVQEGNHYIASCPVMDLGEPLFVFANLTYDTGSALSLPRGYRETALLTVTSLCRRAFPHQLAESGVKAKGERQRLIDDFSSGWRDWSRTGGDHRAHWSFETHKLNDPAWVGPRNASLSFGVETTQPGETLAVILETDKWRIYSGRKTRQYIALVKLDEPERHEVELSVDQFVTPEGEKLEHYDWVTSLILTPGQKILPEVVPTEWKSKVPTFSNLRWIGGEFAERPKPYLREGVSEIDADAAFTREFDEAVRDSVEIEALDQK